MTVLEDLNNNVYQRTMIGNTNTEKSIANQKLKPNSGKIIYKENIIK
jgi:hypothetical protein